MVSDIDILILKLYLPRKKEMKMAALDENSHAHWKERPYGHVDKYDSDTKFFENALKSSHLEGKMSAREMTFAGNVPPMKGIPQA